MDEKCFVFRSIRDGPVFRPQGLQPCSRHTAFGKSSAESCKVYRYILNGYSSPYRARLLKLSMLPQMFTLELND